MEQLSFSDIPPPPPPPIGGARRTDPETSHEAARSVDVVTLEKLVLKALKVRPMTTKELGVFLNLSHITVSPRIAPLRRRGLVRSTGEKRGERAKSLVWEAI